MCSSDLKVSLDDSGVKQAAKLVDRLADVPLAGIVASPLLRCKQTVAPLVAAKEISVVTDARHLTNSGGIPAINFGPGLTRRAHSPNETMGLEDLRATITTLALFLVDYCGIAGEPIASAESATAGAGSSPQPSKPSGAGSRPA